MGAQIVVKDLCKVYRVPEREAGLRAAAQATARLLNTIPLADLTVEDPSIEAVIDQVYREGAML